MPSKGGSPGPPPTKQAPGTKGPSRGWIVMPDGSKVRVMNHKPVNDPAKGKGKGKGKGPKGVKSPAGAGAVGGSASGAVGGSASGAVGGSGASAGAGGFLSPAPRAPAAARPNSGGKTLALLQQVRDAAFGSSSGTSSSASPKPSVQAGRGKAGKGLSRYSAKRHRKVLKDNIQGITKPAIRRLARRGGVKRISGLVYEETRNVVKDWLTLIIKDAVTYTDHAHRKTVSVGDVLQSLKRNGKTLYGFK
jgi:histone H4